MHVCEDQGAHSHIDSAAADGAAERSGRADWSKASASQSRFRVRVKMRENRDRVNALFFACATAFAEAATECVIEASMSDW